MKKRCRRCKHFLGGNKAYCRSCKIKINKAKKSPSPPKTVVIERRIPVEPVREIYLGKKQNCDLCEEPAYLKKHPVTDREPPNSKEFELCPPCYDEWHRKVTANHGVFIK